MITKEEQVGTEMTMTFFLKNVDIFLFPVLYFLKYFSNFAAFYIAVIQE